MDNSNGAKAMKTKMLDTSNITGSYLNTNFHEMRRGDDEWMARDFAHLDAPRQIAAGGMWKFELDGVEWIANIGGWR